MSQIGLLPLPLPGAPPGAAAPRSVAGGAQLLSVGMQQFGKVEDLMALAESGALPPEFLALLQQLLGTGTPLPTAGMPLPGLAAVAAGPASVSMSGLVSDRAFDPALAGLDRQALLGGGPGEAEPLQRAIGQILAGPSEGLALVGQGGRPALDDLLGNPLGQGPSLSMPDGLGALLSGPAVLRAALPGIAVGPGDALLALPQRIGEPVWQQALGERLLWLAGREQQVARLRLNPPHLGPLEVRVVVQQDQASVAFLSQHAAVREALEQAVPRLREMLGQQDLQLVQVDVGERQLPDRQTPVPQERYAPRGGAVGGAFEPQTTVGGGSEGVWVGRGLVDLFV